MGNLMFVLPLFGSGGSGGSGDGKAFLSTFYSLPVWRNLRVEDHVLKIT